MIFVTLVVVVKSEDPSLNEKWVGDLHSLMPCFVCFSLCLVCLRNSLVHVFELLRKIHYWVLIYWSICLVLV